MPLIEKRQHGCVLLMADEVVASHFEAPMQLAVAWGRLTRKRSLYGYADRLIDVACPECQTGITMTNNVRTVRCVNCQAVVQRT